MKEELMDLIGECYEEIEMDDAEGLFTSMDTIVWSVRRTARVAGRAPETDAVIRKALELAFLAYHGMEAYPVGPFGG